MSNTLLSVRDFSVVYDVDPPVRAVTDVSIELQRGEILGLAGESGCGKTTLAYGIQRLLKPPAVITGGDVILHDASGTDIDINGLDAAQMQRFRWDKISMVFQGAMNALNPVASIGKQLEDVFIVHRPDLSKKQRLAEVAELLEILKQISALRHQFGFTVVFITHDLPLLLEISDRIAIMRAGEIVELGTSEQIWTNPQNDYTKTLLASFPRLTGEKGVVAR